MPPSVSSGGQGRLAGRLGGHLAANRFINPPFIQHNKVTLEEKMQSEQIYSGRRFLANLFISIL